METERRKGAGRVVLIGAGPGGPGLLTVAAVEALHASDVVFYDRLAGPAFRRYVRPRTELVDVGKRPGRDDNDQAQIIGRLIAEARAGRTVARVKGGTPFVFGRGFEEVLACAAAGIEVEVIPGVTSALGGAEAAGVPLTHRGLPAFFTVVSGHEDPTKHSPAIDWEALARQEGPVVILMGVGTFPAISQRLLDGGRDPGTPVAAIESATTTAQRVLRAPLDNAAGEFSAAGLTSPALIVVGENAGLGAGLDESLLAPEVTRAARTPRGTRSLAGWRIAVPRSRTGASMLATLLRAEGADVDLVTVLAFAPPPDESGLVAAIGSLEAGDIGLVASSSLLCSEWLLDGLVRHGRDIRLLASTQVLATTGPARRAFEGRGLIPDHSAVPDGDGRTAVVATQSGIDESIIDELASAGWLPLRVDVVSSAVVSPEPESRDAAAAADAVVFASSATASAWQEAGLAVPPVVAAIGPRTAAAVRASGQEVTIEPEEFDLPGIVAAICQWATNRSEDRP